MSFIITIDGPAGAGKSTVARRLALALASTYLDTGAMYRALAWLTQDLNISISDSAEIERIARDMWIEFGELQADGTQTIRVNGNDATALIRTPEVSELTSKVSSLPGVREIVVALQQHIGREAANGVVLEGRDTGTVVFPNASLKLFLTASAEVRARRRTAELRQCGIDADYEQVLKDQIERDHRDSTRAVSPLRPASDAITILSDDRSIEDIVGEIVEIANDRRSAAEDKL